MKYIKIKALQCQLLYYESTTHITSPQDVQGSLSLSPNIQYWVVQGTFMFMAE